MEIGNGLSQDRFPFRVIFQFYALEVQDHKKNSPLELLIVNPY